MEVIIDNIDLKTNIIMIYREGLTDTLKFFSLNTEFVLIKFF